MSGVASHYGADKDKIISIDIEDNKKMYEMSYDLFIKKFFQMYQIMFTVISHLVLLVMVV